MTAVIYIGIILICRIGQKLSNKRTSNLINNTTMFVAYGAFRQILSALIGLVLILLAGNGFKIDPLTVGISVFSGSMLIISMYCGINVLKSGTMALASIFSTAGLLVPSIASIFLFNIPISAMQVFGIEIFFLASYLLVGSSKRIYTNFSFKTIIYLFGLMISTGCTQLAQKMFTEYIPSGDVSVFSLLSFGILGVVLLLALPVVSKSTGQKVESLSKPLIFYGVILSVCVFIINQLATLATALIDPIVLFTFINGGNTIIAAIIAAIVFKEKLTAKSVVGIVLGIISLIIIKAF